MRANYETGVTCLYMCIMTQLVNNVYCTNRCARKKEFIRTEGIYTYCIRYDGDADYDITVEYGRGFRIFMRCGGGRGRLAASRPGGRRGISLALNELPCSCA